MLVWNEKKELFVFCLFVFFYHCRQQQEAASEAAARRRQSRGRTTPARGSCPPRSRTARWPWAGAGCVPAGAGRRSRSPGRASWARRRRTRRAPPTYASCRTSCSSLIPTRKWPDVYRKKKMHLKLHISREKLQLTSEGSSRILIGVTQNDYEHKDEKINF